MNYVCFLNIITKAQTSDKHSDITISEPIEYFIENVFGMTPTWFSYYGYMDIRTLTI